MATRLHVPAEQLVAGELTLTGDSFHYLVRVLRLRAGASVQLFDGAGRQATAEVLRAGKGDAVLRVDEPQPAADAGDGVARIHALVPLIKGERMTWCVQKLVELGVTTILPVQLERCVVRLDGAKAAARRERFVSVAEAAARQCRRSVIPAIAPIAELDGALAAVADADVKIVFWEHSSGEALREVLPAGPVASVAVLVGPEGGLAAAEVDAAISAGFLPAGLGPRILRAETAAVAAVAIIGYELGDLG